MFVHLKRTACITVLGLLLAGGAHAEPAAVTGLIGGPQTSRVFEDELANFETLELEGGARLSLEPGTEIRRLHSTKLQLSGSGKTLTHVFQVTRGRVDVTIPTEKMNQVAAMLVGPKGNTGIVHQGRGILVAKPDVVSFTALDGAMLTGKGSTWKRLAAGTSRAINLRQGIAEESPTLQAPGVDVTQNLKLALPGQGFIAQVKLTPVNGAKRYQVALLKRSGNTLEHVKQVETSDLTVTLAGQEPGQYSIVARALDRFRVPGSISRPDALRVISVGLPQGSRATERAVYVPPNRRVQLVAAEGLQMTYGAGNHFVAAPDSVAMSRGSATQVRFRDPASKQELSLTLVPHVVKAKVHLGPKTARWPGDRIAVTVQLFDGLDEPLRVGDELDARVTVNLDPVEVDWKRDGSTLKGYVPQPNTPGPWVVRVEVMHEAAGLIGRDFLEVAQGKGKKKPGRRGRHAPARK